MRSILGVIAIVIAGCGGSSNDVAQSRCGPGTKNNGAGVCIATARIEPVVACGQGTVEDGGQCVLSHARPGEPGGHDDGGASPPAPNPDTTPPAFAGIEATEALSDAEVRVKWKTAIDDVSPNTKIRYDVAWGDAAGFAPDWALATRTAPGASSAIVARLPYPDTVFYFVARALDEADNASDPNGEASARTLADRTPPTFSGCRAIHDVTAGSVVVDWDAATDVGTATGTIDYEIWIRPAGTAGDPRSKPPAKTVSGGTSATLSGLIPATTYEVLCSAKDAAGNEDPNSHYLEVTTAADRSPPAFKGIAGAVTVDPTTVLVTWSAASDDIARTGEIVYTVYVADQPGAEDYTNPTFVTPPGELSATITYLKTRTTHYFVVRARDTAGNEDGNSIELSVLLPVSLSIDVQPIFTENCAIGVCHTVGVDGSNPPIQGMDMDPGATWSNTVNVVAREGVSLGEPNLKRVDATTPDLNESYLWRKILIPAPSNIFGNYMPPPQAQRTLTADQFQIIADWIAAGAPDN